MSAIASKQAICGAQTQGVTKGTTPVQTEESAPSVPKGNLDGQIRLRAYELYQTRCCNGRAGNPMADWLQAEREIKQNQHPPHLGNSEFKHSVRGEVLLVSGG